MAARSVAFAPAVPRRSPAPAVVVTAVAVAAFNAALASLIVRLAGFQAVGLTPAVALLLLAVGVVAAIGALVLWRRYLRP